MFFNFFREWKLFAISNFVNYIGKDTEDPV